MGASKVLHVFGFFFEENRIRDVRHTPILSIGITIVSLVLVVMSIYSSVVHIGNKKKIATAVLPKLDEGVRAKIFDEIAEGGEGF